MKPRTVVLLIGLISGLCGCSLFKPDYPKEQWMGSFSKNSSGYIAVSPGSSISQIYSIIKDLELFKNIDYKLVDSLVKKTNSLFFNFTFDKEEAGFALILSGNYPVLTLNFLLAVSGAFTHYEEPFQYYTHKKSALQISNPNSYLILITNQDVVSLYSGIQQKYQLSVTSQIKEDLEKSAIFFYFPAFTDKIIPDDIPFNKNRFSIKDAWMSWNSQPLFYYFSGGFQLKNEENTKQFIQGFKLFIVWLLREVKAEDLSVRLKEIEVYNESNMVIFKNIRYTGQEIAAIIRLFIKDYP